MTALLTLENCQLDEEVVYSKENIDSITIEDSNIGCQAGEKNVCQRLSLCPDACLSQ